MYYIFFNILFENMIVYILQKLILIKILNYAQYAFKFTGLVSITIPLSVLCIESFAFAECKKLVDVNCILISSIIIPLQVVLIDC